jgi:hypothetical protein
LARDEAQLCLAAAGNEVALGGDGAPALRLRGEGEALVALAGVPGDAAEARARLAARNRWFGLDLDAPLADPSGLLCPTADGRSATP